MEVCKKRQHYTLSHSAVPSHFQLKRKHGKIQHRPRAEAHASYSRYNCNNKRPGACKGKKVKCTLVLALRLCTGRTAHRGSRGIALLFLDHGTSRGWGVSVTSRPPFTPRKDPVPIVQETGWAPGPVWTGVENLTPTGIRSPDRPARSQLLYRLCLPRYTNYATRPTHAKK